MDMYEARQNKRITNRVISLQSKYKQQSCHSNDIKTFHKSKNILNTIVQREKHLDQLSAFLLPQELNNIGIPEDVLMFFINIIKKVISLNQEKYYIFLWDLYLFISKNQTENTYEMVKYLGEDDSELNDEAIKLLSNTKNNRVEEIINEKTKLEGNIKNLKYEICYDDKSKAKIALLTETIKILSEAINNLGKDLKLIFILNDGVSQDIANTKSIGKNIIIVNLFTGLLDKMDSYLLAGLLIHELGVHTLDVLMFDFSDFQNERKSQNELLGESNEKEKKPHMNSTIKGQQIDHVRIGRQWAEKKEKTALRSSMHLNLLLKTIESNKTDIEGIKKILATYCVDVARMMLNDDKQYAKEHPKEIYKKALYVQEQVIKYLIEIGIEKENIEQYKWNILDAIKYALSLYLLINQANN